jgi:hypothetical protein
LERMTAAEYRELTANKPSKYRAQKTKVDGITFDSKGEADYYCQLKLLQRAGEVTDIKLQPRYPILDASERSRGIDYVADFLVTYADGRQEIIDFKGVRTAVYRMKKKMFHERYPNLEIREVTR